MNRKRIDRFQIIGVIIIIINAYWILDNMYLLYLYHYSNILFLVTFPDWTLILNEILGLVGILIGFKVIRKKIKVKQGILIELLILFIGDSLKTLMTI